MGLNALANKLKLSGREISQEHDSNRRITELRRKLGVLAAALEPLMGFLDADDTLILTQFPERAQAMLSGTGKQTRREKARLRAGTKMAIHEWNQSRATPEEGPGAHAMFTVAEKALELLDEIHELQAESSETLISPEDTYIEEQLLKNFKTLGLTGNPLDEQQESVSLNPTTQSELIK